MLSYSRDFNYSVHENPCLLRRTSIAQSKQELPNLSRDLISNFIFFHGQEG